jgi:hypothetical protein
LALDQPVMFEISLREIRPCLRKARMISTSAEFKRMGAVNRESFFFVLVAELGDKDCTIDSKEIWNDEGRKGWIHYSDLHS